MLTIAQLKQQIDRIWVATFQIDLTNILAVHLHRYAIVGVQDALETAVVEELELHRQRAHQSHPGFIPDPQVPKLRGGNPERPWHALCCYQLAMSLLVDQSLYRYTLGLSIPDLQEALYVLFGHLLSREDDAKLDRGRTAKTG